jgi:hypothetical protein
MAAITQMATIRYNMPNEDSRLETDAQLVVGIQDKQLKNTS